MSHVHLLIAGIENKLFIIFVDGVVGQMDVVIFEIFLFGFLVSLCRKPRQSFFIHVYPDRIAAINKHVNSHIEF